MTAQLNLSDLDSDFEFLSRRRIGDRLQASGFEVNNDGDETSAREGAVVTVSVLYNLFGDGPLVDALVIELPALDPGESFGELTRAFDLPEAEGDIFGTAQIIYTLSIAPEFEGELGFDLVATDQVQITPFSNGDDTVFMTVAHGQSVFQALRGNDVIDAGGAATSPGQPGLHIDAGAGDDTIDGSAGDDRFRGQGGSDVLRGNAGDDTLIGAGGKDRIEGGDGDDVVEGGGGKDRVTGNAGNDFVSGGGGADRVNGGAGDDIVRGEAGRDLIDGDTGADELSGGGGVDSFRFLRSDFFGDVITDYEIGEKLIFQRSFSDIDQIAFTEIGGDLLIHDAPISGAAVSLTLLGIQLDDFDFDALII